MLAGCCKAGLVQYAQRLQTWFAADEAIYACPTPEGKHKCCALQVLADLPAVEKMAAAEDLHAFLNKYHKHAYRLVMPRAQHSNLPVQMWRLRMLPVADSADGCLTILVGCVQINHRLMHNVR